MGFEVHAEIKVMGSSWIMPKGSSMRVQVAVVHAPTGCGHGSGQDMRVSCFRRENDVGERYSRRPSPSR